MPPNTSIHNIVCKQRWPDSHHARKDCPQFHHMKRHQKKIAHHQKETKFCIRTGNCPNSDTANMKKQAWRGNEEGRKKKHMKKSNSRKEYNSKINENGDLAKT